MRVYVLSVPHTGTHWTIELLERMGCEVRHTHCTTVGGGWVREGRRVVVPWRDPVLAKISELNRVDRHRNGYRYPKVRPGGVAAVAELARNAENVFLIPVPASDAMTERLARWLGVEARSPDPAPVNASADVTGLKARYAAGEDFSDHPELGPFVDGWSATPAEPCADACCREEEAVA